MATDATTLRVLVVDDSTATTESSAMLLRLWGYDVQEGYSGADAIALTSDYQPDVIFLDIGLPDVNGWEVARCLREQSPPCKAFLVAVSGYGTEQDLRRSMEAGFDAHLRKPADPQEVQKLLENVGGGSSDRKTAPQFGSCFRTVGFHHFRPAIEAQPSSPIFSSMVDH